MLRIGSTRCCRSHSVGFISTGTHVEEIQCFSKSKHLKKRIYVCSYSITSSNNHCSQVALKAVSLWIKQLPWTEFAISWWQGVRHWFERKTLTSLKFRSKCTRTLYATEKRSVFLNISQLGFFHVKFLGCPSTHNVIYCVKIIMWIQVFTERYNYLQFMMKRYS